MSNCLSSPLLSPAAPFLCSTSGGSSVASGEVAPGGDSAFLFDILNTLFGFNAGGCTARHEACCREDAVFSRTPNWVGRGFMVTILCVLTEDASYGFLLVAVVRVLVLLV